MEKISGVYCIENIINGTKLTWRYATKDEINAYLEEYKQSYMSNKESINIGSFYI